MSGALNDPQKLDLLRRYYQGGHRFADAIVSAWPEAERDRVDSLLARQEDEPTA
jgi:hypothetical protein